MNNINNLNSPNLNSLNNQANPNDLSNTFEDTEEIVTHYFVDLWEEVSNERNEEEELGRWSEPSNFSI